MVVTAQYMPDSRLSNFWGCAGFSISYITTLATMISRNRTRNAATISWRRFCSTRPMARNPRM